MLGSKELRAIREVIEGQPKAKPLHSALLMALAAHQSREGRCNPSKETLSAYTASSERSVSRHLKDMARWGAIKWKSGGLKESGGSISNSYELCFLHDVVSDAAVPVGTTCSSDQSERVSPPANIASRPNDDSASRPNGNFASRPNQDFASRPNSGLLVGQYVSDEALEAKPLEANPRSENLEAETEANTKASPSDVMPDVTPDRFVIFRKALVTVCGCDSPDDIPNEAEYRRAFNAMIREQLVLGTMSNSQEEMLSFFEHVGDVTGKGDPAEFLRTVLKILIAGEWPGIMNVPFYEKPSRFEDFLVRKSNGQLLKVGPRAERETSR